MVAAPDRLRRALEASRREQSLGYARSLAGEPPEPSRALAFLVSDEAFEELQRAQEGGELSPSEYASLCAHFARARLEHAYRRTRVAQLGFAAEAIEVDNERLRAGDAFFEWSRSRVVARRQLLVRAVDWAITALNERVLEGRARADAALSSLAQRVTLPRHADAGPEGGTSEPAERFLRDTDDLTREALQGLERLEGREGEDAGEALHALLGTRLVGLFPQEGQARRVALDWEPLGLRRQLTAHARLTYTHPGPGLFPHVLAVNPPHDVRIAPSRLGIGLGGELALIEGVGRAVGHVHASPALPLASRLGSVASVARTMGALALLRIAEPGFLRKVRGLVRKDAEEVARASAAFVLVDARFAAAAVLARPLRAGPETQTRAAELASRALTRRLPEGLGAALVLRLSPGGPFRARHEALGLAWALREQFDEDWFQNPRVAEPLRGAMARASEFSAEAFASELGGRTAEGLSKLAELF